MKKSKLDPSEKSGDAKGRDHSSPKEHPKFDRKASRSGSSDGDNDGKDGATFNDRTHEDSDSGDKE